MEKVSVIIPVYNDEKYLHQCVDSVLKQTYHNLEVILVDDGSTDQSPTICEEYRQQDSRVRVMHKKNGGVGSSRNAGLSMATGKYILFVDNDDWLDERHIEQLHKLLKEKNADIAVANFSIFHPENGVFSFFVTQKDYYQKDYTPAEWTGIQYTSHYNLSQVYTVPWCKLYKRELFNNVQYPLKAKVEDDLTTWKVYFKANKISFMNKAIYVHRLFADSVTAKVDKTSLFPLTSIEQRIAFMRSANLDPDQIKIDIANEKDAYYWRLNVYRNHLNSQNKRQYYDAIFKQRILRKYGSIW